MMRNREKENIPPATISNLQPEILYLNKTFDNPCSDGIIRIIQMNATGIQGKCDEMVELLIEQKAVLAFISETWLRKGQCPHPCILHAFAGTIPTINVTHQPHGIAIMIHPFFLNKQSSDIFDIISIHEDPKKTYGPYMITGMILKKLKITFAYFSPSKETSSIESDLFTLFEDQKNKKTHVDNITGYKRVPDMTAPIDLFFGDLNMRLGVTTGDKFVNARGKIIHNILMNQGLNLQTYDNFGVPTYHSSIGESIVDYFYVSAHLKHDIVSCRVLNDNDIGSDHVPCLISVRLSTPSVHQPEPRYSWNTRKLKNKETVSKYKEFFSKRLPKLHHEFYWRIAAWLEKTRTRPVQDIDNSGTNVTNSTTFHDVTNMTMTDIDNMYMTDNQIRSYNSELIEKLNELITNAIEMTCLRVLGTTRSRKKTFTNWFIDKHLRREIHKRRRLYDVWRKQNDKIKKLQKREEYIMQRNHVAKMFKEKKDTAFQNFVTNVETMKKNEATKVINGLKQKRTGRSMHALDTSDDAMEKYGAYFSTLYRNDVDDIPFSNVADIGYNRVADIQSLVHVADSTTAKNPLKQSRLTRYIQKKVSPLETHIHTLKQVLTKDTNETISLFSILSIEMAIHWLPSAKAPGKSKITSEMLKPIKHELSPLLSLLFALCYLTSYTPIAWREALLVPIYKKDDAKDIKNYRPISLTEIFRKLYEQLLMPAFTCYIEPLSIYQNGFRSFRSTVDHVAVLHYIAQMIKGPNNEPLEYAFLDIKSAYDKVNRSILWQKLQRKGLPLKLVAAAQSLFDNTSSCVIIGNKRSKTFNIETGLLQGSILSPLFYSLFINDLADVLCREGPYIHLDHNPRPINCLLYADDVVLISKNLDDMSRLLRICENHAIKNHYSFNPKKCELLYNPKLHRRIDVEESTTLPCNRVTNMYLTTTELYITKFKDIKLHGQHLTLSTRFNYLGVYFNQRGIDIDTQIQESINQAKQQTNLMTTIGANAYAFSAQMNIKIYKLFIRPILEYCLCIMPLTKTQLNALESTQHYCLTKFLSVSTHTNMLATQLLYGVADLTTRQKELQASWILKTKALQGEFLIKDCLRHDEWYTRTYGRRKRKIPFKGIDDNEFVLAYQSQAKEHADITIVPNTTNRYAILQNTDIFIETTFKDEQSNRVDIILSDNEKKSPSTSSVPDNVPYIVHHTLKRCSSLPDINSCTTRVADIQKKTFKTFYVKCHDDTALLGKEIRYSSFYQWYDKDTFKKTKIQVRTNIAKQKMTKHKHMSTIKNLEPLNPNGIEVITLLATKHIKDKQAKRIMILWILNKFNTHDVICKNCIGGFPATMQHMMFCCQIPEKIRALRKSRVRYLIDLVRPELNRTSVNNYKLACQIIYRMLNNCRGLQLSLDKERWQGALTRIKTKMKRQRPRNNQVDKCTTSNHVVESSTSNHDALDTTILYTRL